LRDNGAIEGGAAGFAEDDEVVILRKYDDSKIYVIAHEDGIRECTPSDLVVVLIGVEGWDKTTAFVWKPGGRTFYKNLVDYEDEDFQAWLATMEDVGEDMFADFHEDNTPYKLDPHLPEHEIIGDVSYTYHEAVESSYNFPQSYYAQCMLPPIEPPKYVGMRIQRADWTQLTYTYYCLVDYGGGEYGWEWRDNYTDPDIVLWDAYTSGGYYRVYGFYGPLGLIKEFDSSSIGWGSTSTYYPGESIGRAWDEWTYIHSPKQISPPDPDWTPDELILNSNTWIDLVPNSFVGSFSLETICTVFPVIYSSVTERTEHYCQSSPPYANIKTESMIYNARSINVHAQVIRASKDPELTGPDYTSGYDWQSASRDSYFEDAIKEAILFELNLNSINAPLIGDFRFAVKIMRKKIT